MLKSRFSKLLFRLATRYRSKTHRPKEFSFISFHLLRFMLYVGSAIWKPRGFIVFFRLIDKFFMVSLKGASMPNCSLCWFLNGWWFFYLPPETFFLPLSKLTPSGKSSQLLHRMSLFLQICRQWYEKCLNVWSLNFLSLFCWTGLKQNDCFCAAEAWQLASRFGVLAVIVAVCLGEECPFLFSTIFSIWEEKHPTRMVF